jgi:carbonic anhydrase
VKTLPQLFANNRAWAARMTRADPDFFQRLAQQQTPEFLWIGCSDSRVPANEIVGLPPGELFVHRNVANVVVQSDMNCMAVLQFAVEVLKTKHVIVCGHYGCGGVRAALEGQTHGLIHHWLAHIRDTARKHRDELAAVADAGARVNRLCQLNVIEQVHHLGHAAVVQAAWARGQPLCLHGWIYDIADGLLADLQVSAASAAELRALENG